MAEITFDIKRNIATLSTKNVGGEIWTLELNIVSWNGGRYKYDIREWNKKHDRMTKGITLTQNEAKKLMEELTNYFFKLDSADI